MKTATSLFTFVGCAVGVRMNPGETQWQKMIDLTDQFTKLFTKFGCDKKTATYFLNECHWQYSEAVAKYEKVNYIKY